MAGKGCVVKRVPGQVLLSLPGVLLPVSTPTKTRLAGLTVLLRAQTPGRGNTTAP